ncbi:hypothetical protein HO173_000617 [Letharia columbiana]|uniref:Uncharacterized protein n=1 Tax=Letharia columbiana TaxID=112416 RepID=A0A8H6G802_9LECA|nr:uncharacterized protein HO173_000617 [Letharia columbiana]KAF6241905.1 hypothetical protein HO173_000617 [Letharia columbiana]
MDADGYAIQGRRRGGTNREPVRDRDQESFLREVPRYAGTSENYDRAHAQRYGREEGLGPDGKHNHGSYQFPRGTDRQKLHSQYSASTKGRDAARGAYQKGLGAAQDGAEKTFNERILTATIACRTNKTITDYADNAYGEYEYARDQQTHHERYRSYSNVDERRDQWGRPVSHR